MMTAESMLSKRPVWRFTAASLFFAKVFSSRIYCIQTVRHSKFIVEPPHFSDYVQISLKSSGLHSGLIN